MPADPEARHTFLGTIRSRRSAVDQRLRLCCELLTQIRQSESRALSGRLAFLEVQLFCNSQLDEDEWVDRVFENATDLSVLESGANKGVAHSVSSFLDLAPVFRALHRKCHFLSGELSITDGVSSFLFRQLSEQAEASF